MRTTAVLSPFLTERRKERIESVLSQRTRDLALVLEDIYDPHNMAACLRSAEGLGVQEVHVVEGQAKFAPSKKITIGADKWLDIAHHKNPKLCVQTLKDRGFNICAGALRDDAVSLTELDFSKPTALVFGNEHAGLSDDFIEQCDQVFAIPMTGFTQSFNISVSAAICLFHGVQERCRIFGSSGSLEPEDAENIRARWYTLSVPMSEHILERVRNGTLPPPPSQVE